MATQEQLQARDELYEAAHGYIEQCVAEYIRKRADELKEAYPDRQKADWHALRQDADVKDDDLWWIAGDVIHASGVICYTDDEAREQFGFHDEDELWDHIKRRIHDDLDSETCWGSVIVDDIIDTYDVEMRPEGHPTLKRAMQEHGVTAEQIMRHCATDRLPTVYDRINHGWGTFSPHEMSEIWKWRFSDMNPLELFDMNLQDVWNMRCDYLTESAACERILGIKE